MVTVVAINSDIMKYRMAEFVRFIEAKDKKTFLGYDEEESIAISILVSKLFKLCR